MLSDSKKKFEVAVRYRGDDWMPEIFHTMRLRENEAVGTQLQREIPFWTPENPVLLDLPPGSGKTSFIYNALLPEALARGKNLLLVSNRVALSSQQKQAILKKFNSPQLRLLTDEGVRRTEDFGPVRVITYHRLPALVHDSESISWMSNLAFAVFDEAHFFTADAIFNSEAEYYLRLACKRFCRAVRIYMSATTWDVLEPLARAEERFYIPQ